MNKRYQILRTIGRGGMGAVYQARDLKRQTICAVKEMSLSMVPPEERAQAVQNFKAEAKMLAGLHHPNLPTFSDFFTEGARHFLVMEYIDGVTLDDYLGQNLAPFPEQRVLAWARQLCDVLTYLHSQYPPIIFRDMKPGNIMLTHNGRIKLIDFGIARFFRHTSSQDTQLLGTPGFAPPEQYGKAQTDERSDIYSLAMTLSQLMTNTLSEKGFGLQNVDLINPDISPQVAQALERAAALSPDDRFQSVEEFRRALFVKGNVATIPASSAGSQNSRAWLRSRQVPMGVTLSSRQSAPPEILVQPMTIDFGEVYPGLSESLKLSIIGDRSTFIQGTITVNEPWILVDRATFDGASTRVNVQVDTSRLRASMHYTGDIRVIPDEEDEEQDIVVKVEVEVLDRAKTPGLRPAAAMNGQSRPGQLRVGPALDLDDEDDEDDEDDTLDDTVIASASTSASGMLMVPPISTATGPFTGNSEHRAKYGEPGRKNNPSLWRWDPLQASPLWLQRGLTVFAAFMLASLCFTILSEISWPAHKSLLPPNPAFIVVLVGMLPMAALGALVVDWKRTWSSRETLSRLYTGLNMALLTVGPGEFIWQFLLRLNIAPLQLFVMLLLAAVGGTIGTHPTVSGKLIDTFALAVEYVRLLAIIGALLVGGLLGLALTTGFALSFFTLLGLLAGCTSSMTLVLWIDHLLKQHSP